MKVVRNAIELKKIRLCVEVSFRMFVVFVFSQRFGSGSISS